MGLHAFAPSRFVRGSEGFRPRLLDVFDTIAVTGDPVTLTETKEWLRVDGTDQDDVITALIRAATEWAEFYTQRAFINRALQVTFASFPPVGVDLYLLKPPVSQLPGIAYVDSAGADQVFDPADVTFERATGLVRVNRDASENWPQNVFSATFDYTAGFGPTDEFVPEEIKTAVKIAIAQMFEMRMDQTFGAQASKPQTKASMALLQQFRMWRV